MHIIKKIQINYKKKYIKNFLNFIKKKILIYNFFYKIILYLT